MEQHRIYDAEGCMDINGMRAAHYDLWTWLADNPDKRKEGWPGWAEKCYKYDGHSISTGCFLCEAMKGDCRVCPLTQGDYPECCASGSLYDLWKHARRIGHYRTARELALQIRDAWR